MHDQLFQENLNFLKQHSSPITYQRAQQQPTSLPSCPDSTFHVDIDGKQLLLHSRRDPAAEANRQISNYLKSLNPLPGLVVVLGLGGLYHIQALVEATPSSVALFIVELSPATLNQALHQCNFSALAGNQNRQLFISCLDNLKHIATEYRRFFSNQPTMSFDIFQHPGSNRAFSAQFSQLRQFLDQETRKEIMNKSTIAYLSGEWQQHAILTLQHTLYEPPLEALHNCFKDQSAVIVAAGPSLNESIDYLVHLREHVIIICVGNALRPLLNAGINPDFIVAVDSDPKCLKQFECQQAISGFLVAPHLLCPQIIERFKGQMFIFSTPALAGFNSWLANLTPLPANLSTGGTVTITAADLALYIGCNRLFFLGFDLAYLKDGTSHASKTMYEQHHTNDKLVKVAGNYEQWVFTSKQFATYIDMANTHFLSITNNYQVELYNVTSGGARFEYLKLIKPNQINQFQFDKPGDKEHIIRGIYASGKHALSNEQVQQFFEQTKTELSDLKTLAQYALKLCSTVNISEIDAELNRIDNSIKSRKLANQLISTALEPVIMQLFSQKQDNNEILLEQNKTLYKQISDISDWVIGLLETADI